MANPHTVTFEVQDNDNETAKASFFLGSNLTTLAAIIAEAQALIESFQTLMTGQVISASVNIPFDISGWALTPSAGADTDRLVGGRFIHTAVGTPNAKKALNLPTFDVASYVGVPGNLVNLTDVTVAAVLADILAASYVSSSDVPLDLLVSAKETYGGKSR